MLTVDQLKDFLKAVEDQDLARIFGRTKAAVSQWRANGVPANIERKAMAMMANGDRALAIQLSGKQNYLDVHNVSEQTTEYSSPATQMILDIIKDWDEKRRRKLAADIVAMNGEEDKP